MFAAELILHSFKVHDAVNVFLHFMFDGNIWDREEIGIFLFEQQKLLVMYILHE